MKTAELTGAALDWAVCVAEYGYGADYKTNRYSTDWAHGGPIIEREAISLKQWPGAWTAELEYLPDDDANYRYGKEGGPTPLIAAMRCYAASKLGDTVEVPIDLL